MDQLARPICETKEHDFAQKAVSGMVANFNLVQCNQVMGYMREILQTFAGELHADNESKMKQIAAENSELVKLNF
jgi:hypothetical protein